MFVYFELYASSSQEVNLIFTPVVQGQTRTKELNVSLESCTLGHSRLAYPRLVDSRLTYSRLGCSRLAHWSLEDS